MSTAPHFKVVAADRFEFHQPDWTDVGTVTRAAQAMASNQRQVMTVMTFSDLTDDWVVVDVRQPK